MDSAERGDLRISERAAVAIESMRNSEDLIYYLARNPEVCQGLFGDDATQKIGEISAQLMANPPQATQAQNPRQQHPPEAVDPELHQKFDNHYKRLKTALAARPDAASLIASAEKSGIGVSSAVHVAILEQENSEQVLMQLLESPDLRAELNRLSYPGAMARITKMSAQLES